MERTDIRLLLPTLKIMRPYLPRSLVSYIERVFGKSSPTRTQMNEITRLGRSIGLERNEIIAAVDAPLSSQGVPSEGRASILIPIVLVSILVVVSALLIWAAVDPDSFPFHLYVPGTLYGTIQPQDFSSHEIIPLVI
ncbi:MAG: hypothetical protein ACFFEV_06655 [Candidatus Thorarchaeota archaeon]